MLSRLARSARRVHLQKSSASAVSSTSRQSAIRSMGALNAMPKRSFSATAAAGAKPNMFCYQCEQTEHHTGCTVVGNCGKTPEVAALQDHLLFCLKSLGAYAHLARQEGVQIPLEMDRFTVNALFSTLTNVNFDAARFPIYISQCIKYRDQAKQLYEDACRAKNKTPVQVPGVVGSWTPRDMTSVESLTQEGKDLFGVWDRRQALGDDICGLQELLQYGLKGIAAYASHAATLGQNSEKVYAAVHEGLAFLADSSRNTDAGNLVAMAMKLGEANLVCMEYLEAGHKATFGTPSPTKVRITAVPGKCILVSGHDMHDLKQLLEQTEGKGINIYTHGEMLPAHAYPELRKYPHLVGNYGSAWQLQKMEFAKFPGPIVMTSNCIIEPRESYKNRIFTLDQVGWPGVEHVHSRDFSKVIEKALAEPGFTKAEPEKFIETGFHKDAVMSLAGPIIDAVKSGALKRVFVIGGCDGAEGERNYYKELAVQSPKDSVILTMGCGKYRFNKLGLGTIDIGGTTLPRVLDMGQCNDAYGAISIALALSKALNVDVNSLPISYAISWFEQKAVAVFLTMLYLGVKNIHLGPALPAFVTPNTLKFLVDNFNLKATDVANVSNDLKLMLQNQ